MNNERLVQQYASLARFVILFFIWGTVGYQYRLYMDLTVSGPVLSLLFFGASTLVMLGWKTRSSMIALALALVAHAFLLHTKSPLPGAGLAAFSAFLPIGASYSVDRYLQVPAPVSAYIASTPEAERQPAPWAIPLFIGLVVLIVGGPTYNQLLNRDSKWFRAWDMYHVIGKDLVNVRFFEGSGAGQTRVGYMEALGHKNPGFGVFRDGKVQPDAQIIGTDNLQQAIQQMCDASDRPASLRLEARIATLKQGWKTLYDGSEPICDMRGRRPGR